MENYENLSLESLPNEEWRDVIGYEDAYQVSSLGRVRSKDRVVTSARYKNRREKGRILKQRFDRDGYLTFNPKWNGRSQLLKVHREVAKAFVPNPHNRPQVDHINGIRHCNVVDNLRWCTTKENQTFVLARQNKSQATTMSYQDNDELRKIRANTFRKASSRPVVAYYEGKKVNTFDSQRDAAKHYGISESKVSDIVLGRLDNYNGYTFRRKDE